MVILGSRSVQISREHPISGYGVSQSGQDHHSRINSSLKECRKTCFWKCLFYDSIPKRIRAVITNISVDGYRSLVAFDMKVIQGPNILIGPNGSGKSNIIGFFQFLSRLTGSSLSDAVSLSGGAGAFFTKEGEQEYRRGMTASIAGFTFVDERSYGTRRGTFSYEYSFSIQASEKFDRIYFTDQEIKVRRESTDHIPLDIAPGQKKEWDLILKYTEDAAKPLDLLEFNGSAFGNKNVVKRQSEVRRILEEDFDNNHNLAENASLLRLIHNLYEINHIASDIKGGQTININPAEIKKPEDSARNPGIQSDGSGLAATLWHLQQDDNAPSFPYFYAWRNYSTSFLPPPGGWKNVHDQIQQLIKRVNPQIESMFAGNDPFDNQLKIRVKMAPSEKGVELPLSAMSDGSIKWAALITAVLTHRAIFAIEEPENFLHPYMQAEIVKIMRETSSRKFSSVIMTTHSETLLNAANPEDVVVISMKDGITFARRIKNPLQLHKEIVKTGFGLGNYYLAGDLVDA